MVLDVSQQEAQALMAAVIRCCTSNKSKEKYPVAYVRQLNGVRARLYRVLARYERGQERGSHLSRAADTLSGPPATWTI